MWIKTLREKELFQLGRGPSIAVFSWPKPNDFFIVDIFYPKDTSVSDALVAFQFIDEEAESRRIVIDRSSMIVISEEVRKLSEKKSEYSAFEIELNLFDQNKLDPESGTDRNVEGSIEVVLEKKNCLIRFRSEALERTLEKEFDSKEILKSLFDSIQFFFCQIMPFYKIDSKTTLVKKKSYFSVFEDGTEKEFLFSLSEIEPFFDLTEEIGKFKSGRIGVELTDSYAILKFSSDFELHLDLIEFQSILIWIKRRACQFESGVWARNRWKERIQALAEAKKEELLKLRGLEEASLNES